MAKFVAFAPDAHPNNNICILPKFLTTNHPPQTLARPPPVKKKPAKKTMQCISPKIQYNNHVQQTGQAERDNNSYNNLVKMANFSIADGYFSFTCTFRYLGLLINYSLCNNEDITARIASATTAMSALKEVWHNPHLNIYNKYLHFQAIPMNLLLWGAETWSL
jgi:hypothetical protein